MCKTVTKLLKAVYLKFWEVIKVITVDRYSYRQVESGQWM